jgi:predicted nucleic acid-binding protein
VAVLLTVDASVFVASCHRDEPGHAASRALLSALRTTDIPLIEPMILPVEVAAALGRAGTEIALAREYALAILALPRLTLVPIDERLAHRAIAVALEHGLRGADALYATVAVHYGARLVTLDDEQLTRAPSLVAACTPGQAMTLLT